VPYGFEKNQMTDRIIVLNCFSLKDGTSAAARLASPESGKKKIKINAKKIVH
jgi:hypothetical protein